ncbi:MAG: hypothetical protein EZS28_000960 [Streblomastix strix]|uniref:Uncharacterized protein n=1 Tax=Streblomastix strix TaxID=222440 RepID=A0A5J4X8M6_9EUKA|nr:MAG: hypothetical protein EZS28_000960 [Streblomastix strix]
MNESQIVTIRNLASLIGESSYIYFQFPQISLSMNAINNLKTKSKAKWGQNASVRLQQQILDASDDSWGMTLEHNQEQIMDAGQWLGSWHLHSSNFEGVSRGINTSQIVEVINIDVEGQMYITEDRQHNN